MFGCLGALVAVVKISSLRRLTRDYNILATEPVLAPLAPYATFLQRPLLPYPYANKYRGPGR